MEYWTWWIGGGALGLFAVIFSLLTGKPLGVSGSWLSIARRKDDAVLKASAEVLEAGGDQVKDDLMAMTMAEFGEDIAEDIPQRREGEADAVISDEPKLKQDYTPWTVHVLFLVTMFLGSYLAVLTTGDDFSWSLDLSPLHNQIFENDGEAWLALLFGGMMVGFGTQMAGGCTSGHGLSGSAQLIPASLLSTAIFFGSATALTILMNSMV